MPLGATEWTHAHELSCLALSRVMLANLKKRVGIGADRS